MELFEYDRKEGVVPLCGVDEAGRGPLAGPVYAAAVILDPAVPIPGLNDSKKLTAKRREELDREIREKAAAFSVASASVEEIEQLNILQASLLAMRRAVEGLAVRPALVLVDGNRTLRLEDIHSRCLVKGDATSACVAAASVLAKVARDRHMLQLERQYPQYQFARHKGYGTALHYQLLDQYGPCPAHRPSFLRTYQPGREDARAVRGRLGEQAAEDWLTQRGWEILERNYRCPWGELDRIARKEGLLAFVEVKTRTEGAPAAAREAVGPAKQKRLLRAALTYLQEHPGRLQPRFDVAEVYLSKGKPPAFVRINYLENAFDGSGLDASL